MPHPMNTARKLSNHLKYPRNILEDWRTNSTTKDREEATVKKVGSAEIQFGREKDYGHLSREGATSTEKGKRQTSI